MLVAMKRSNSPKSFGLAYSDDLIHWSKCNFNPIFHNGLPGSWDDLAIWFGTVYGWGEERYMLYEGCARQPLNASPISQIGLARVMTRPCRPDMTNRKLTWRRPKEALWKISPCKQEARFPRNEWRAMFGLWRAWDRGTQARRGNIKRQAMYLINSKVQGRMFEGIK